MKIAIATDHGAIDLKKKLIAHLEGKGHEVTDFGAYEPVSSDYPVYAAAAARAVAKGECQRGIALCTTGIGMSIACNKVKGIRCALLHDVKSAELTEEALALQLVDIWLDTEFSGAERHVRRNAMVMALENE